MKAVLMLLLVVIGIAGGGALGFALRPAGPSAVAGHEGKAGKAHEAGDAGAGGDAAASGDPHGSESGAEAHYVGFSRKFVVPVVDGDETRALLILDLAIDAPASTGNRLQAMRPRLRDAMLRVLFEFAATGAFGETYIEAPIMEELRQKLLAAARTHAGPDVREVLVLDLVRKEF